MLSASSSRWPDHRHVRHFRDLPLPHPVVERFLACVHVHPDARGLEPRGDGAGAVGLRVGDRDHPHLLRREPHRKRAGEVLDQVTGEAFQRAVMARWIIAGRCGLLSAPVYSSSKRSGRLKSSWIVGPCHIRPIASRNLMSIFGP